MCFKLIAQLKLVARSLKLKVFFIKIQNTHKLYVNVRELESYSKSTSKKSLFSLFYQNPRTYYDTTTSVLYASSTRKVPFMPWPTSKTGISHFKERFLSVIWKKEWFTLYGGKRILVITWLNPFFYGWDKGFSRILDERVNVLLRFLNAYLQKGGCFPYLLPDAVLKRIKKHLLNYAKHRLIRTSKLGRFKSPRNFYLPVETKAELITIKPNALTIHESIFIVDESGVTTIKPYVVTIPESIFIVDELGVTTIETRMICLIIVPKVTPTCISRRYDLTNLNLDLESQFLRKNKIYNKGRYSRYRQVYRIGFYMCLAFNVALIFGFYLGLLGFSPRYTYLLQLFLLSVYALFILSVLRLRLQELSTLTCRLLHIITYHKRTVWAYYDLHKKFVLSTSTIYTLYTLLQNFPTVMFNFYAEHFITFSPKQAVSYFRSSKPWLPMYTLLLMCLFGFIDKLRRFFNFFPRWFWYSSLFLFIATYIFFIIVMIQLVDQMFN